MIPILAQGWKMNASWKGACPMCAVDLGEAHIVSGAAPLGCVGCHLHNSYAQSRQHSQTLTLSQWMGMQGAMTRILTY